VCLRALFGTAVYGPPSAMRPEDVALDGSGEITPAVLEKASWAARLYLHGIVKHGSKGCAGAACLLCLCLCQPVSPLCERTFAASNLSRCKS
jgi:hypothetical protein